MSLGQRLSLSPRLQQRLALTPAMQQAIRLLPLTTLELAEVLNAEMAENPMLEEVETEEDVQRSESDLRDVEGEVGDSEAGEMTAGSEAAGEAGSVSENASATLETDVAPSEHTSSLEDADIEKLFENVFDEPRERDFAAQDPDSEFSFENRLATTPDLRDHLRTQLHVRAPSETLRVLGEAVIENLDDDGFLRTHDSACEEKDHDACGRTIETTAEDICRSADLDPSIHLEDAQRAIELVQTLDPPGVGARNFVECLLLQLCAYGYAETLAIDMVRDHWKLLQARDIAGLVRVTGLSAAEVEDFIDLIESLDPRPGGVYSSKKPSYVVPDVFIVKGEQGFEVDLNDDSLPRLCVSPSYRQFLNAAATDEEAKTYVREKMKSALFLIKSVDQRQKTLFKVATSIAERQRGFLEYGVKGLRPLVLRDVAEDIGMHESTVSRIVANKYAHTPQGVVPLRFFFHSGLKSDSGDAVSSVAIKEKIKAMIDAENREKPLSDSQIAKVLSAQGTTIARRTVAKYREELRIQSSSDRKGRRA